MQGTQQPLLDKSESSRVSDKAYITQVSNTFESDKTRFTKMMMILQEIKLHFIVITVLLLNSYML